MGKVGGLAAMGILLSTAGCVEAMNSGYPATSYGYGYGAPAYYSGGYYNRGYYPGSYYSQPSYVYRPAPVTSYNYYTTYRAPPPTVVTQTRYVPVPTPSPHHHHHNSWDKNGDGVPDRWQRRW